MRKLLLSTSMVLVIAMALAGIAKADSTTTIAVDPAQIEVNVGESHIVNITITDVNNLALWMFRLKWNNSLLQLNSIVEGPFLKEGGATLFMCPTDYTKINADGELNEVSCAITGLEPDDLGMSGSGVLATLNFTASAVGTTTIEFFEDLPTWPEKTMLKDPDYNTITHTIETGVVDIIPEFPVSMFIALFLMTALLVVALKKKMWTTDRRTIDVK